MTQADFITVEALCGAPERTGATISPDGTLPRALEEQTQCLD